MCGIHLVISRSPSNGPSATLARRLANRGPDHLGRVYASYSGPPVSDQLGDQLHLSFTSTVLSLRGDHVTPQPFVDQQSDHILCWNGEAWKLGGNTLVGNDGQALFHLLRAKAASNQVLEAMRAIEGPFAFVYLDKTHGAVYFGRDRLGRRSLLIKEDEDGITISSIADSQSVSWREVEADGIYVLDLDACLRRASPTLSAIRYDWLPGKTDNYVSSVKPASGRQHAITDMPRFLALASST
jgi:asparagine synthetase B (glutamine-hydrolysing)